VNYWLPHGIADGPAFDVVISGLNNENTDSNCWFSYRTQTWDDDANQWVTLDATNTAQSPLNTWIVGSSYSDADDGSGHFNSNAYQIKLTYANVQAFVDAYGHDSPSIRMRSVVEAPGNNIKYDEYEVFIKYDCWYDQISIAFADDMSQVNYNFGDVTTGKAY
jgi:hypothetical protein